VVGGTTSGDESCGGGYNFDMPPRYRLSPPMRQTQSPRFWEMDEYDFEDMGAALLDKQPDVRLANCFGDRGQKQFGADIVGDLIDGGLIVAQCKCYEVFQPAEIDKASNKFLKHLAY
jgi:hypothetical protein